MEYNRLNAYFRHAVGLHVQWRIHFSSTILFSHTEWSKTRLQNKGEATPMRHRFIAPTIVKIGVGLYVYGTYHKIKTGYHFTSSLLLLLLLIYNGRFCLK